MYYPGLFESASPYSTISTNSPATSTSSNSGRPFGSASSSADQHHAELCNSLMDNTNKKMVSNLSTSSLGGNSLSLTSPFRATHFPAGLAHYRPSAGTATDLMSSPYVGPPSSSSSSGAHLPGSDSGLGSSLLHEQSFLEASTPYGIGPLPSPYSPYPTSYLGNSVINPALKAPNGNTYPPHNSFYPPGGPPYHSFYPESFISDYITRNHIDASKAAAAAVYNSAAPDNSSFMEHLKRLQESFQSKSPKTTEGSSANVAANNHDSNNSQHHQPRLSSNHVASVNQCSSLYPTSNNHQPVRPEPISMQMCPNGSKSPVINSNLHQIGGDNFFACPNLSNVSSATTSPITTSASSRPSNRTCKTECDVSNSLSQLKNSSTNSIDHVRHHSHHQKQQQQQLPDGNQCLVPSPHDSNVSSVPCDHNSKHHDTTTSVKQSESTGKHSKGAKSNSGAAPKSGQYHSTNSPNDAPDNNNKGEGEHHKPIIVATIRPKQHKQAPAKKRNRSAAINECGQCAEEIGHEKIKKQCKHQLWRPDTNEKIKSDMSSTPKEATKAAPPSLHETKGDKKTVPRKNKSGTSTVDAKASKKANGNGRRRRFRSGLDMIRNSRKKAPPKPKLPNAAKKEKSAKKDIALKDLRLETKRLIVNKSLGETLLHRSARNNRVDVVRFCLESEACDVNARDNAGYTPLHECSSRGNLEVARLLLEHSADANASATGGIRPLHDAIENNHIELVRLLLSYGADPNISTYSGSTPLQLCRSKAMFKFLKGFYSDISTERPVIDATTLAWKFGHQSSATGFDVFADVPSDGEELESLFHFSETPVLPSYCLMHTSSSSFYLLCDVLQATELSEADFHSRHPQIEISKITKADFVKASLSQLEERLVRPDDRFEHDDEVRVIYTNDAINDILRISSTVII